MASTYLTRTTGTASLNTKMTFSTWIKRSSISSSVAFFSFSTDGSNELYFRFQDNDALQVFSQKSGSTIIVRKTNRVFRDVSAWYHLVLQIDTTQVTASNRIKIYVNGVQETSFSAETNPNQNETINYVSNATFEIGRKTTSSNLYMDGSMSHIHFIDGIAYDATAFGEYDANGVWKIKTSPSVTYGTNGFFILKDGNSVTDQSGNSNNFTLGGGTLTKTEDNPSNVFATLNSLNSWGTNVLSNGNLTITSTSADAAHTQSTMHMNKGKWYMEFNIDAHTAGNSAPMFILAGTGAYQQQQIGFSTSGDGAYGIGSNGRSITDGAESGSVVFTELVNNDKVQIAFDADTGKVWFGINGTYLGSGNPSTGANPYFTTTKLQNNDVSLTILGYGTQGKASCNFGNGYFGTTAITTNSGNGYSGAEGSSKFNYTVPTGYSALSTKGLNE